MCVDSGISLILNQFDGQRTNINLNEDKCYYAIKKNFHQYDVKPSNIGFIYFLRFSIKILKIFNNPSYTARPLVCCSSVPGNYHNS